VNLITMAFLPSHLLSHSKARRAANNNYSKRTQTLYAKLTKQCLEHNTHIYFLAYRNGQFNGFVSALLVRLSSFQKTRAVESQLPMAPATGRRKRLASSLAKDSQGR